MSERVEVMWCTLCGARFTQEEIKGWGCPKCGNAGVPCDCKKDVTVKVNWHELHILCVWAENFARSIPQGDTDPTKTVHAIARRLQRQFPDHGSLTLSGELAELPVKLQDMGLGITAVTPINIDRPPPIPINGPGAA